MSSNDSPRHRRASAPSSEPSEPAGRIGYFPEAEQAEAWREDARNATGRVDEAPEDDPIIRHAHEPRQRRALKLLPRWALAAVCVCVLCYSAFSLIRYGLDYLNAERASDELRQIHEESLVAQEPTATAEPAPATAEPTLATATPPEAETRAALPTETTQAEASARLTTYPGNPTMHVLQTVLTLREKNKDIVGWLNIDGVLDEAVVQRDNSYYLTRDYLGKSNATGALFLDENCKLTSVPEKLVIHGHNMKTGKMFGILKKYKVKGVDFYKQNYLITFESPFEKAEYVIFAIAECDTRPGERDYLDFISSPIFSGDEAFDQFVRKLKELSMYTSDLDVRRGDRLLLLATCSGTEESERLVVAARTLREDEDDIALKLAVYSAKAK